MIPLTYGVTPNLKQILNKIEALRIDILTMAISPKQERRISWESMIDRIFWSLSYSNHAVKRGRIIEIFTKQTSTRLSSLDKEIIDYRRALNYIYYNWLGSDKDISYRTLHEIIDIIPHQTAPRFTREEIEKVMDYVKRGKDHPVVQAAILQSAIYLLNQLDSKQTVFWQLAPYISLYKYGYDIRGFLVLEEYWCNDQNTMQAMLKQTVKSDTLTLWIDYFAEALLIQLEKVKNKIAKMSFNQNVPRNFWELNDRQKAIIEFLEAPNSTITNKMVQKKYHISQITASRDLTKLASLGLLLVHGKGRSVSYIRM